ncbi:hypothetical protein ACFL2X_07855 [Candidatus Latescibacterota bacterium]
MKKLQAVLLSLLLLLALTVNAEEKSPLDIYPHIILSNGLIEASVFLPNNEKGFYRSSRFEWSGMIWQLTYKDHTFFTERVKPHNPETSGHSMSLAEEFCIGTNKAIPQRFTEAKPGETFMKIGVGNLEKPLDNNEYHFSTQYKIIDSGKWETSYGEDWVEFTHTLEDPYGFAYIYRKRMELTKGKPELVFSNSLTNTGSKTLIADQYNHNFFTFDHEPIGKGYSVERFFSGTSNTGFSPAGTVEGNKIVILEQLEKSLFGKFEGFDSSVGKNHVIIRNSNVNAGVDITGDFTLSGFNFYSSPKAICPELFVWINIEPGETQKWKRNYNFFAG